MLRSLALFPAVLIIGIMRIVFDRGPPGVLLKQQMHGRLCMKK